MTKPNAYLPFARSTLPEELRQRPPELSKGRAIIAYYRGPYCLIAVNAVLRLPCLKKKATLPFICGKVLPRGTPRKKYCIRENL